MKRLLIVLIFLLASSFTYQTEYKATSFGTTSSYIDNRRGAINENNVTLSRFGYATQRGTYTPSYGGNAGRNGNGGRPRRVVIRSGNDSIDTGRQNDYNPDWKYYHGRLFGGWYYDDGKKVWAWNGEEWEETLSIVEWGSKSADAHQSVPVGDVDIWFDILAVSIYVLYTYRKESRLAK